MPSAASWQADVLSAEQPACRGPGLVQREDVDQQETVQTPISLEDIEAHQVPLWKGQ